MQKDEDQRSNNGIPGSGKQDKMDPDNAAGGKNRGRGLGEAAAKAGVMEREVDSVGEAAAKGAAEEALCE